MRVCAYGPICECVCGGLVRMRVCAYARMRVCAYVRMGVYAYVRVVCFHFIRSTMTKISKIAWSGQLRS